MIAMAILSGALTGLTLTLTRAIRAGNHARLMTTATFLCRAKLGELEDKFVTDGFTDEAGVVQKSGGFKDAPYNDPSFTRYQWSYLIEKIKLPSTNDMQQAATKLLQDRQQIGGGDSSSSSSSTPSGSSSGSPSMASGMNNMLGPVKDMLEQGIRRITMRILWDEPGRPGQMVEVVTFYTDMRRIPVSS
jgi:hypothetical protein